MLNKGLCGCQALLLHLCIDSKGTKGATIGADRLVLRAGLFHDELKLGGRDTDSKILQALVNVNVFVE